MIKNNNTIVTIVASLVSSAVIFSSLQAQTVLSGDHVVEGKLDVGTATDKGGIEVAGETGGNASPGIKVTGDGGVLFEGTFGVGKIPVEGAGTRLMWYPKKAAFRVGRADEDGSMEGWIGNDSMAFGFESIASGANSAAMSGGVAWSAGSTAVSGGETSGSYSTAMSEGEAFGNYSTAMSVGLATGAGSSAMSGGGANGNYSTAMSGGETYGNYSTAMSGGYIEVDGVYSTVMSGGYAEGAFSIAMSGGGTVGNYSIAAGKGTYASSYRSVVMGSYNASSEEESRTTWVQADPLFVIGNGTGDLNDPQEIRYRDAFVIRKNGSFEMNGNVNVSGAVRIAPQGDLSMGSFTQEPTP